MIIEIHYRGEVIHEIELDDLGMMDMKAVEFSFRMPSRMANGKEEYIRLPKVSRVPHEPVNRKRGQYLSSVPRNFREQNANDKKGKQKTPVF